LFIAITPFLVAVGDDEAPAFRTPRVAEGASGVDGFGAALNVEWPILRSFAHDGTSPQRIKVRMRCRSREMTTGSFVVGAAFQRGL